MARAGIDLGGTKIQTVVVDDHDNVLGQARVLTPRDRGSAGVLESMADAVRSAMDASGVASLTAVGVGAPGQVDNAAGTVTHAVNLPDWEGSIKVAAMLHEALGAPVALANDVQVGVIGESRLGAGRNYRSMVGVFCGTGVGGGIVIDGRPWLGRGAAGEIGHMIVKPEGRLCACGKEGCLEAYAGRGAMENRARALHAKGHHTELFRIMEQKGRDRLASGVWAKALEHGDHMATELVDEAVWALGYAAANAVNLLDVEAVVIGGGLGTRLGQPFADRIRESMLPHLVQPGRPPAVRCAELGDLGGAIGASLLAASLIG